MASGLHVEPKLGDAFGAALLECFEQGIPPARVFEIVERDDGYIDALDAAFYFSLPDGDRTQWVLDRARGTVLDIGAGAGRWALAVQARGLDVLALDISPGAIAVCEQRGVRRTFTGTVEDLVRSAGGERFDTFLMMGNNLGLVAAPTLLDALAGLANPGARVLAEGNDAEDTRRPEHLAYHELNRRRGRVPGQLRLRDRHGAVVGPWFDYLMPSLDALRLLLHQAGWSIEETMQEDGRSQYLVAFSKD